MEGLEAVEINLAECLSVIDFRIDANTYKKDYIRTEELLRKLNTQTIEEKSISVQNFGAYSLCNFINFVEKGIPFLMTENIRHNYIDWNIQKCVDDKSHAMLVKSHCKKNQVLVTMAGEYLGRVAVYDKDEVCSSNQAIAKITLNKNENPFVISTFLNSKHGQNQINRLKTITGQPNINMSLIKSLKIPSFSIQITHAIENLILNSNKFRYDSIAIYSEAQEILLQELGLINWSPVIKNNNIKTLKESFLKSDRFDAEFYQPKYDELENIIKNRPYYKISEIRTINYRGFQPKYVEDGTIDVINSKHIQETILDYDGFEKTSKEEWDAKERARIFKGDILTYTTGANIGRTQTYLIDKPALGSNHVNIIRLKKEMNPIYVGFVMNSIIGRLQTDKYSAGSAQPELYPKDLDEFLIPILPELAQYAIANKIQESFKLQKETKLLLEAAKNAVEIAIEKNEKEAIKYLEKLNYA